MKTDIEIAQSTQMQHIADIARTAGVDEEYLEFYGKYKAKIDYRLLQESKAPNGKLREFMMGEVRFSGLTRTFPQIAEQLFAEAEEQCAARYAQYEKLAAQK